MYNLSLKYRSLSKNEAGKAFTYSNIGLVYANQNISDSCIHYLNKSLDLHYKYNNQKGVGNTLKYLGDYYMALGKLKNAEAHYLESYSIATKHNDLNKIKNVINALIGLYQSLSDFKQVVLLMTELKEIEQNIKKGALGD